MEVCANAALYFAPEDAQAMARAMIRIVEDDGLKKTLVERGLARARLFSWERAARLTLELLEEAASSN